MSQTAPVEPSPDGGEPVEWIRLPTTASLENVQVGGMSVIGGGLAAVGCAGALDCLAPAIWLTDGGGWGPRVDLPLAAGETKGVARTVTAGPGGVVVGGHAWRGDVIHAALWYSPDGRAFERVADDGAFRDASVNALIVRESRWIAVGSGAWTEFAGFRAWWSDDGRHWTAVAEGEQTALADAVVLEAGRVLAFGASCGVCLPDTHWWWSSDGASWTVGGLAPGLAKVHLRSVVSTQGGLVGGGSAPGANGEPEPGIWARPIGEEQWSRRDAPALPPGSQIEEVVQVGSGLVVVARTPRGSSTATLVAGAARGADPWVLLAELPDTDPVAVVGHPTDPRGLVVLGRTGADGTGPIATWVGGVPWTP